MAYEPTDEQCIEIGESVIGGALSVFQDLDIESDFCVQSIGFQTVVFGGTNRIIWSLRYGFSLDVRYCTPSVVAKWGAMNGQPKWWD